MVSDRRRFKRAEELSGGNGLPLRRSVIMRKNKGKPCCWTSPREGARIRPDPADPDSARLHSLPWELSMEPRPAVALGDRARKAT